nr:30S ribosomal protein S3 [Candidatus Babeliales bacterium]
IIIRKYLESSLDKAEVARIEIKKTGGMVKIVIHSARPGYVIGKGGQEVEVLRKKLAEKLQVNSIDISVEEVKTPELDAVLVAKNIAAQLEQRANFKKLMKKATASAMRAGARGIKICCKGRLNGAEIARAEWSRVGSVPLHTLRAKISYGYIRAQTVMGVIGVKVWICVGEYQTK